MAQANIDAFNKKIKAEHRITLNQGNAIDLTQYADNSFDIVLLFGPLYHLHNEADRQICIAEAKRVCKDNGTIFFAFISNDMVIMTEFMFDQDFFSKQDYHHDTFKVTDFPFVFFTLDQIRDMLHDGQVHIEKEVAADGLSELLANKINALDDYSYQQYLKYHFYCCEKKELIGYSNHLLFIARN